MVAYQCGNTRRLCVGVRAAGWSQTWCSCTSSVGSCCTTTWDYSPGVFFCPIIESLNITYCVNVVAWAFSMSWHTSIGQHFYFPVARGFNILSWVLLGATTALLIQYSFMQWNSVISANRWCSRLQCQGRHQDGFGVLNVLDRVVQKLLGLNILRSFYNASLKGNWGGIRYSGATYVELFLWDFSVTTSSVHI